MWISKDEYRKLREKAETAEYRVDDNNYWRKEYERVVNERGTAHARAEEAKTAQRKTEAALEAATRISYVVAHHRNDAAANQRHASLNAAVDKYQQQCKENSEYTRQFPVCIYAMRGDNVIADVTDPTKWDETLPVSEKRADITPIGIGSIAPAHLAVLNGR